MRCSFVVETHFCVEVFDLLLSCQEARQSLCNALQIFTEKAKNRITLYPVSKIAGMQAEGSLLSSLKQDSRASTRLDSKFDASTLSSDGIVNLSEDNKN